MSCGDASLRAPHSARICASAASMALSSPSSRLADAGVPGVAAGPAAVRAGFLSASYGVRWAAPGPGAGILAALGARLLVRCLSSEAIFAFISRRETMASTIP